MNFIKQLKPYSLTEKLEVIKYRIGEIFIRNSSNYVKNCYSLTSKLIHQGIDVKKTKHNIQFSYPINNKEFFFDLKKESSDVYVFKQIIEKQEYKCILDILRKHNIKCNIIIDAGANIGLTTLYFKAFLPKSKIFALEPLNETFYRMQNHIDANKSEGVIALEKGLWSHSTCLKGDYTFRDRQEWSFRLEEALEKEPANFMVISIKDLCFEYNLDEIDFLKIDIEGSELELFKKESELSWLNKVKVIALEIHNEFNCKEFIEKILIKNNFELLYSGELTIGVNKNLVIK